MSALDNILKIAEVIHIDAAFPGQHFHGVNTPATKQQIKTLMLEIIEDVYIERTRQEARKSGYETGTRLVKRLLKKAVEEL